jgi:AAA+ ATPase superfamily predicted ATPase
MTPFIGRKRELQLLEELFERNIASLAVVKGRRRIGKTRLIEEFAKKHKFIALSGLAPTEKITAQHQRDEFAKQMSRSLQVPYIPQNDWSDLFWFLADQTKKGGVVILLDEISWMASKDPAFLGKLKTAWDKHFKKNPKLIMVLCGSVSSWIEKNILSSTGFVGRIDLVLSLEELSLTECNQFWGS